MDKYELLEKIEHLICLGSNTLDKDEFEGFLCEVDDLIQVYSEEDDEE